MGPVCLGGSLTHTHITGVHEVLLQLTCRAGYLDVDELT